MKKLLTVSGIVLGSIVGATAAYYLSPKDGKSYQKEVKKIANKAEERILETGLEVLDQWIDFLEGSAELPVDEEVISLTIESKD